MEISVSPQTKKLIEMASKKLNLDNEKTITIAIESYIRVYDDPELKKELEMWEEAGLEDLNSFLKENEL